MALDWGTLFVPSGSILEIFVRGTVTYLGIVALFRVIPRRGPDQRDREALTAFIAAAEIF